MCIGDDLPGIEFEFWVFCMTDLSFLFGEEQKQERDKEHEFLFLLLFPMVYMQKNKPFLSFLI